MQEAKAFFRAASFQGIRGEEHHLCVFSDLHGNNVWVTALTAPSSSGFYTRDLIVLLTTWCNRVIFYDLILFYWWRRNAVTSTVMDGWKCWRSSSHDATFPSCIQQTSLWINLVAWRRVNPRNNWLCYLKITLQICDYFADSCLAPGIPQASHQRSWCQPHQGMPVDAELTCYAHK